MSHGEQSVDERELVRSTRNTARYFTEARQVAWVALVFTLLFGVYGYIRMPKAKDPQIDIKVAVVVCPWPGAEAGKLEQLITRRIEQKIGGLQSVERVQSVSREHYAAIYVFLRENVSEPRTTWNDIQQRLDTIDDLPEGAGPIQLQRDFGETATLMLTVASPAISAAELELRARSLEHAISQVRGERPQRATLVLSFPPDMAASPLWRLRQAARDHFSRVPGVRDAVLVDATGALGLDMQTSLDDAALIAELRRFAVDHLRTSDLSPDLWKPLVVRELRELRSGLMGAQAAKYSYRELDRLTQLIQRRLQALPLVAKVGRSGELGERVYVDYSQKRWSQLGFPPALLQRAIGDRNIQGPAGLIEVAGRNVTLQASGELSSERQIGATEIARDANGHPVLVSDVAEISRDYETPARQLNFLTWRDEHGNVLRTRAITLAVYMRSGAQIADFGAEVDGALTNIQPLLPDDLILRRTSDQPLQVRENVDLFMRTLYEAIALVVGVALIGFWEWRAALLLALCIPITLAMTFGLMWACGIDIQQISIASLIIALGLLVDDPIVASDAIKESLRAGWPASVAAWLGPTKLARAIVFATFTNIASYLPFLTLSGDTGTFIRSLPIVLTLSLIASRIVSMTFVPLLGFYLLRPSATEQSRSSGMLARLYGALVSWSIQHRFLVLGASVLAMLAAGVACQGIKPAFFPKDLSYLSYVDVWLPEDAPLSETQRVVEQANQIIRSVAAKYGSEQTEDSTQPVLASLTEFVGGGAPRFWFSVPPEMQQSNYAQLLIQLTHKEDTRKLVARFQRALSQGIAGARIDVRELETGKPVGIPVSLRFSGDDSQTLRQVAEQAKVILRQAPGAERIRDDWGADTLALRLDIAEARANASGISNLDVVRSSASALNGAVVGELREQDRRIPIVSRLRADELVQAGTLDSLYVSSARGGPDVPLASIAHSRYSVQGGQIRRRNFTRTITVACFPAPGVPSSDILKAIEPQLSRLRASLPAGVRFELGAEAEEQARSFGEMANVLALLLIAVYVALVVQFRHAVKPFIVLAALPFGVTTALASLVIMHAPLGFMASLGVISLLGVIVSHIIVLFDYIEEARERGESLHQALIEATQARARPVLITVIATVLGLFPLAAHGGPLWEPLCYVQIGGLCAATIVTLLLVPVLYTICVRDLKWIAWETDEALHAAGVRRESATEISGWATAEGRPLLRTNAGR